MLTYTKEISIKRQSELLSISRSNFYYKPATLSCVDLEIMQKIDEIYLEHQYFGSRRITESLNRLGYLVGRKKTSSLMKKMGIEALYPKPKTTMTNKSHKKYPYLLKGLSIQAPNYVWAADITYIPMPQGFMYLVAIIDWFSRYIIGWELSNSLDSYFCVSLLESLLQQTKPYICNTDQGVQFTSTGWIECLEVNQVKISMDGKGRAIDNIIVERFWRSLKHESIYLNPVDTVKELRDLIKNHIAFYNYKRPHQGLKYQVAAELFYNN